MIQQHVLLCGTVEPAMSSHSNEQPTSVITQNAFLYTNELLMGSHLP